MDRLVVKSDPHLFDLAFSYIQTALSEELTWLDHILPCCERLVKIINGRKYYTPNIFIDGNEYELISPDAKDLGNYSFFILSEPQEINYDVGLRVRVKSPFSLVVWVDLTTLTYYDERNTETLKRDILRAIRKTWMKSGSFAITKVYQRAENIFKEFTLDELDNQYLMQPYCGFRFDGEITIEEECEDVS